MHMCIDCVLRSLASPENGEPDDDEATELYLCVYTSVLHLGTLCTALCDVATVFSFSEPPSQRTGAKQNFTSMMYLQCTHIPSAMHDIVIIFRFQTCPLFDHNSQSKFAAMRLNISIFKQQIN